MRFGIIAFFVLTAWIAGWAIGGTAGVSAEGHAPTNQWQYQCFQAEGVAQVTERANKMGEQGWELTTAAGMKGETLWCFKRPLWKSK